MTTQTETVHLLKPTTIEPPVFNSRVNFDEGELAALMRDIEQDGQRQAIEVQDLGDGKYRLNFGARRLEACKRLDRPVKAVIVAKMDDKAATMRNGGENLQRADLTTFETARYFAALRTLEVPGKETAERYGFSPGYVSMLTQLFVKLAPQVKDGWERASTIEKERDPGKLTAADRGLVRACAIEFLYRDVMKAGAHDKQVKVWTDAIAELSKVADEREESAAEGKGKGKGKGSKAGKGGGAAATVRRVDADRLAEVNDAIKVAFPDKNDAKRVKLFVQYLVGDIDKVKGFLPVAKSEVVKVETKKAV